MWRLRESAAVKRFRAEMGERLNMQAWKWALKIHKEEFPRSTLKLEDTIGIIRAQLENPEISQSTSWERLFCRRYELYDLFGPQTQSKIDAEKAERSGEVFSTLDRKALEQAFAELPETQAWKRLEGPRPRTIEDLAPFLTYMRGKRKKPLKTVSLVQIAFWELYVKNFRTRSNRPQLEEEDWD